MACAQGLDEVRSAVQSCSAGADAPTVVFISKMVAVPAGALPRRPGEVGGVPSGEEVFLGVGRVFSGNLSDGQPIHVLSAAYDPAKPDAHKQDVQVYYPSDLALHAACCPPKLIVFWICITRAPFLTL